LSHKKRDAIGCLHVANKIINSVNSNPFSAAGRKVYPNSCHIVTYKDLICKLTRRTLFLESINFLILQKLNTWLLLFHIYEK